MAEESQNSYSILRNPYSFFIGTLGTGADMFKIKQGLLQDKLYYEGMKKAAEIDKNDKDAWRKMIAEQLNKVPLNQPNTNTMADFYNFMMDMDKRRGEEARADRLAWLKALEEAMKKKDEPPVVQGASNTQGYIYDRLSPAPANISFAVNNDLFRPGEYKGKETFYYAGPVEERNYIKSRTKYPDTSSWNGATNDGLVRIIDWER